MEAIKPIEGTMPKTGRVAAVQQYLMTCGMPREAMMTAWERDDLSGIVARVEGYYGKFIGIEITTRDAVQNLLMDSTLDDTCGIATLSPDDIIRPCVLKPGHDGFCDPGVR